MIRTTVTSRSSPSGPSVHPGFVPVPNCSDDPSLPQAGRPCIKSRKAFPKCPPTPLIDQGDWWFEIWAIDNGRYQG